MYTFKIKYFLKFRKLRLYKKAQFLKNCKGGDKKKLEV